MPEVNGGNDLGPNSLFQDMGPTKSVVDEIMDNNKQSLVR